MRTLLKKYFGFDDFRPLQEEIVQHVMSGRDTCVIMPTGSGKSLCYQLPALALDGVTLVVSPLIALMKDQVDALQANGVPATCINSTYSAAEIKQTIHETRAGRWKLLYLAPERLALPAFQDTLKTLPVCLIAIDEAHCISEWGHDFRPDYRNLSSLRRLFPHLPWIALTATANERVRTDIVSQLALQAPRLFMSSFNRPNLTYLVRPKKNWLAVTLQALEHTRGSSVIVYCFSRKDTERVAERLCQRGWPALPYHAGLDDNTRRTTQEKFVRDECPIVVATVAFGMGIDKPNVRLVVHADLPRSIEGYYQETGRAGRDGLPSTCLFFYQPGDRWKREWIIRQASPEEQVRTRAQLTDMTRYAETRGCRRAFLLGYFGERWPETTCGGCDVCLPQQQEEFVPANEGDTYDIALFEALRTLRKRLAEARQVPPYVILSDRTLRELARAYPQSLPSLRRIHGIGAEKERTFGKIVLQLIQAYAKKYNKSDLTDVSSPEPLGDSIQVTKYHLEQKLSLPEIARRRGLAESTIMSHLEKIMQQEPLDISHLKPRDEARLQKIRTAFRASPGSALSPVYERLGKTIPYEELRLARLFVQR